MSNVVKTFLFLTLLTLLFVFLGQLIGGQEGALIAFIFACVMNFGAYWFSDKIVLSMYHAQEISESSFPEIFSIVHQLCEEKKLPLPKIYLIPSAAPNAFATGRNPHHAVIAVTQGILDLLGDEELKGVLAHELAHIQHRDILIATLAATFAGAISMLASMARWSLMFGGGRSNDREGHQNPLGLIFMVILIPIAATIIQLAVSRSREYHADEEGGQWCGNPLYLASALRKLDLGSKRLPMRNAEPATAHLFIVNPLHGGGLMNLFSTHPPIEERIARLEKMARENGQ